MSTSGLHTPSQVGSVRGPSRPTSAQHSTCSSIVYDLQTPQSNRFMANIERNIEVRQALPAVAPVHLQAHFETTNPYFPYDPTTTHHPLQPELLSNYIVIPLVAQ